MGQPLKYPVEFRESAVAMVRDTGKPIAQVAGDLGINKGTLGNWVDECRVDGGGVKGFGLAPLTYEQQHPATGMAA